MLKIIYAVKIKSQRHDSDLNHTAKTRQEQLALEHGRIDRQRCRDPTVHLFVKQKIAHDVHDLAKRMSK
jgi:hypothetical protein